MNKKTKDTPNYCTMNVVNGQTDRQTSKWTYYKGPTILSLTTIIVLEMMYVNMFVFIVRVLYLQNVK